MIDAGIMTTAKKMFKSLRSWTNNINDSRKAKVGFIFQDNLQSQLQNHQNVQWKIKNVSEIRWSSFLIQLNFNLFHKFSIKKPFLEKVYNWKKEIHFSVA